MRFAFGVAVDDAGETTQLGGDCANLLNDAAPAATEGSWSW